MESLSATPSFPRTRESIAAARIPVAAGTRILSRSSYGLSLLLTLALGALPCPAAFEFFEPVRPPRAFQTMVHRGMMRQAPENTAPAIELAIRDGIEWVEVDVRLTSDHKHILFHDSELDGKTNGKGPLKERPLEELLGLDAGGWFAPRFAGTRLISLGEGLALCKGRINLYLDCKEIDPENLASEVLAAGMEKQVVVYEEPKVLARVAAASEGRVAVMAKWRPEMGLERPFDDLAVAAIELDADGVTPEICNAFHNKGIKVQAKVLDEWDTPAVWTKCLDAGVDWFQTDLPEELIPHALWRRLGERPARFSLHRGALRYAPENTLAAFDKATRIGADFVEIDVRPSGDGEYFLLHDGKLDRTTDGQGPIREIASEKLRLLDAGSWFGKPFRDTRIPTLEEFLSFIGSKAEIYFDAKDIPPADLANALEKHDLDERAVVYQSVEYLLELKKINPRIRALPPLPNVDMLDGLNKDLRPYAVDASFEMVSKEMIARCHAHKVKVFTDALSEELGPEDLLRLIDWGIDVIQTDEPMKLVRAMELGRARKTE